jgi:hypothetical protein
VSTPRVLPQTRSPRQRPGPWAPGPSPVALGSGLPHTSATQRLARRCPSRQRTHRTPPASRTSTPRARAIVALAPGGRNPAGLARCAMPGGRHAGGGRGRPQPCRSPQSTAEMRGLDPCRVGLGCAAPAGVSDQRRSHPCPQGSGGRRLGLPRARPGQPTSATATGTTTPGHPGDQRDGPGQAMSTRPTTRGTRSTCPRRHRGHGPCVGGLSVGHGPSGAGDPVRPHDRWPCHPSRSRCAHVPGQRRRPGVGSPSTA